MSFSGSLFPEFEALLDNAFVWRTRLRCDEVIDIVDNATGDYTLEDSGGEDSAPVMTFQKTNVVRAKLQVDTRFKVMAAENPKRYGINQRPAAAAREVDAPRGHEDAKNVTPATRLIDLHPMTEVLRALRSPSKPEADGQVLSVCGRLIGMAGLARMMPRMKTHPQHSQGFQSDHFEHRVAARLCGAGA